MPGSTTAAVRLTGAAALAATLDLPLRAFPGASRHWRLITTPWNRLNYSSWVVVPAVVFVLLIGFG